MDSDTTLLLANRAFLYALVSRMYAEEPDGAFLQLLAGEHARQEVGLLDAPLSESIQAAYDGIVELSLRPCAVEELSREYVRIFIGPGTLKAPPYESVQITGERTLFQPRSLQVKERYCEAGFTPAGNGHVPADFVGTEFDFLSALAVRALQLWQAGSTVSANEDLVRAKAFLNEHVLAWIGRFAESLEAGYGKCFYSHVARFSHLIARRDADEVLPGLMKEGMRR